MGQKTPNSNHRVYRQQILTAILEVTPSKAIGRVRTAFSEHDKHALLNTIRAEHGEGVVFKNVNARYPPGRPASGGDALKHKFKASASCAVLSHSFGKRSVQIAVSNDDANASILERFIEIGNVAIHGSEPLPPVGSVIEVEYLYAFHGGALFQPVYKGPRRDLHYPDAYASLKFKPESAEGD
jgi:bifunctional non-homologous end joining protein LigD